MDLIFESSNSPGLKHAAVAVIGIYWATQASGCWTRVVKLGAGGFGVVFKGFNKEHNRWEAMKTCSPEPLYKNMLELEAQASWDDMWTAPVRFEMAAAICETALPPSSCDPGR